MNRLPLLLVVVAVMSCTRNPDWSQLVALVHVTKQSPDYASPWFDADSSSETHLGSHIGGGKFLTTAFAIQDATLVEIEFFGSQIRTAARVLHVDREANLALVTPQSDIAMPKLQAFEWMTDNAEGEQVQIVVARSGNRAEGRSARITELTQRSSSLGPYLLPTYELETAGDQRSYGWSEPVVRNGKLVGLSTGSAGSAVFALSAQVIQHFIDDLDSGDYRGFPALGVQVRPLTSPEYRQLLGSKVESEGVVVTAVHANSPLAGKIKPDDILVSLDGHAIDQHGYINDERFGRVHFTVIMTRKFSGERASVKILRSGRSENFEVELRRFNSNELLIPYFRENTRQPYLIVGGLIFQELTKGLLESFGKDWLEAAPPHWVMDWTYNNFGSPSIGKRVVVLTRVLADKLNDGYHDLENQTIARVNGQEVENLQQLAAVLQAKHTDPDGTRIVRFDFALDGGSAFLNLAEVSAAHQRLGKALNIPQNAHFFQP